MGVGNSNATLVSTHCLYVNSPTDGEAVENQQNFTDHVTCGECVRTCNMWRMYRKHVTCGESTKDWSLIVTRR